MNYLYTSYIEYNLVRNNLHKGTYIIDMNYLLNNNLKYKIGNPWFNHFYNFRREIHITNMNLQRDNYQNYMNNTGYYQNLSTNYMYHNILNILNQINSSFKHIQNIFVLCCLCISDSFGYTENTYLHSDNKKIYIRCTRQTCIFRNLKVSNFGKYLMCYRKNIDLYM